MLMAVVRNIWFGSYAKKLNQSNTGTFTEGAIEQWSLSASGIHSENHTALTLNFSFSTWGHMNAQYAWLHSHKRDSCVCVFIRTQEVRPSCRVSTQGRVRRRRYVSTGCQNVLRLEAPWRKPVSCIFLFHLLVTVSQSCVPLALNGNWNCYFWQ